LNYTVIALCGGCRVNDGTDGVATAGTGASLTSLWLYKHPATELQASAVIKPSAMRFVFTMLTLLNPKTFMV